MFAMSSRNRPKLTLASVSLTIRNSSKSISLAFVNGNNGDTVLTLQTSGTAASSDYPDIPDEGLLCPDGAFVNFLAADVASFTVFYN